MSVIWILVSFSVAVAACFLAAFIWAVRHGQYDDRYTPSVRMLFDDRQASDQSKSSSSS
jgi:cbb3-type cytochrome oxidase maturation protein